MDYAESPAEAPAAAITDSEGNEILLDAKAYRELTTFLRVIGVAPKTSEAEDDLRLTAGQAAQIAGTSPKTIARLIDSGRLPGSCANGDYRTVMLSDLLAFKRECHDTASIHIERARALADEAGLYGNEYATELADYLDGFA